MCCGWDIGFLEVFLCQDIGGDLVLIGGDGDVLCFECD